MTRITPIEDKSYQSKIFEAQGGSELVVASGGQIFVEGNTSGDGLSPQIWGDCPLLQLSVDPTLGVYYFDDFTSVGVTGNPYLITGANGTFLAVPNVQYGQARLLATGADNDECYVSSNNNIAGLIKANAASQWWFEARVKLSQIAAEQGVFVGLSKEAAVAADFMTDDTMALKVQNYLGFQIIHPTAAAAIWQLAMCLDAGARVAINAAAANGSTNFVKLGIKSVPNAAATAATVTFYIDGVAVSTTVLTSATNFPLDKVMQITFATKTGLGAANSLIVDWVTAAQLR